MAASISGSSQASSSQEFHGLPTNVKTSLSKCTLRRKKVFSENEIQSLSHFVPSEFSPKKNTFKLSHSLRVYNPAGSNDFLAFSLKHRIKGTDKRFYPAVDLNTGNSIGFICINPDKQKKCQAEVKIINTLTQSKEASPYIIQLLFCDNLERPARLLMPRYSTDLNFYAARFRRLSFLTQLEGIRDIASALGHLHKMGFIHRDLKPENILADAHVNSEGELVLRLVLSDFGVTIQESDLEKKRFPWGSPDFFSSEQSYLYNLYFHHPDEIRSESVSFESLPEDVKQATRAITTKSDMFSLFLTIGAVFGRLFPTTTESPVEPTASMEPGVFWKNFYQTTPLGSQNPADRPSAEEFLKVINGYIEDVRKARKE